ncbi:uncharacterized protein LOC108826409 isoform X2 [Raphanus sativus]|uniref:Uncharacterized protein LOC108826409 isoform X2 n=1 Tax=Raphanus sativus TaxID=3726 RepID=A0A9W3CDJ2_RAPSA|nr:uncharacterized protein LOC108826409 isoform X2 [Raphanus sativus]
MATTTITNRVSLKFLAPMVRNRNLKSSNLRKPESLCFSNVGSSIVPRLASSSLNQNLFARGLSRSTRTLRRVRASSKDEEEEEKRTWHYQLFSVLKLLINWYFRLICFLILLIWFTWMMILSK